MSHRRLLEVGRDDAHLAKARRHLGEHAKTRAVYPIIVRDENAHPSDRCTSGATPGRGAARARVGCLMRATLVYNAKSGGATSEEHILSALADAGFSVNRTVTKDDLDHCLCHDTDVVIVAGGDGTITRVAKRLAGTHIPMAIVPMGTANNVARSLGLGVDPTAAVRGLERVVERNIDLGVVKGAGSTFYFLEGFGIGVFADVLAEKASRKTKHLRRALGLIADELETYEPQSFELEVEGRDLSGPYVLAAVMNARCLGPALELAPDAKCDDGELDVVLVRPEARHALVTHLKRAVDEADIVLPAFETSRAKHIRVRGDGRWAHIDDRAHELDGYVTIEVAVGAIRLLSPSTSPTEATPAAAHLETRCPAATAPCKHGPR